MGPPTAVSDRVMHMSFNGPVKVTLVVAYAPTEAAHPRGKESFYLQLTATSEAHPHEPMCLHLGDPHAQDAGTTREDMATSAMDALFPVDSGSALDTTAVYDLPLKIHAKLFGNHLSTAPPTKEPSHGHGGRRRPGKVPKIPFAFLSPNDNGRRCLQLCSEHRLFVANSMFPHTPSQSATWYSNTGRTRTAVDLVLGSHRFRTSVMDTRVLPHAISHNTDHRLVVCDIRLRLSSRRPPGGNLPAQVLSAPGPRDATGKTEAQAYYLREISQLLGKTTPTTPQPPEDVETEWTTFHSEFMRAAAQALPRPTRAPKQRHITTATVDLSTAKADALLVAKEARWKYQGSPSDTTQAAMEEAVAGFRAVNRECRRSATADLAAFQESEARCLQEAYEDRHTRVVFNKINVLTGRTGAAPIASIKSPTGDPTSDPQTIANVLATHSERTLNVESTRDPGGRASAPTIEQVMKAIQKLKNTAPGICAVTAQMLKLGGNAVASRLHRVISVTWASGRCPQSWKEATLTYIYKGKEDKLLPDNYRGISLLSVCSKVYTNVLIDRLKTTIEPTLHEAQCGFRASRGCADQLFTTRRICELSKPGRAPLFAAFVDYRKAFNSINREAMWKLMAARGVDPHLRPSPAVP
eukprot:gene9719-biopygen6906